MDDISKFAGHLWTAITHLSTADKITLLLAALALLVSIWSTVISRRNLRAAVRTAEATALQAKATQQQADAANEQSLSAQAQASAAYDQARDAARYAEAEMLEAARARIDTTAPNLAVALTMISDQPGFAENSYELPAPLPELPVGQKRKLSHWPHWHYDVFFVIQGTLYNSSAEAVRVTLAGPAFYAGKHPLTAEQVPVPQWAHPRDQTYLLYPGQHALFQILGRRQVDDWLNLAGKGDHASHPVDKFICQPGCADDPMTTILVRTEAEPVVRRLDDDDGDWATLVESCHVRVTVEFDRPYPASFDRIHAELTQDPDAIANVVLRDELQREIRQLRGPDIQPPLRELAQLRMLREKAGEEPRDE